MKYQKTRYVLARVLAVILTLTAVFGLSAPLITQAASNVSVLYRYDGDGTETKNRVGIRSVIINDKKYFDIHDGSVTDRVDPNNQIAFLQAVLQSGNETDGGTDSLIGPKAARSIAPESNRGICARPSPRRTACNGNETNRHGRSLLSSADFPTDRRDIRFNGNRPTMPRSRT